MDRTPETNLQPSPALRAVTGLIPFGAAIVCLATVGVALSRSGGILTTGQWALFVVTPLIAAIVLFRLARAEPTRRVGPSFSIVATAVGLLVAEVALTVLPMITPAEPSEFTVAALLDSLREAGVLSYPAIPGSVLVARDATVTIAGESLHPLSPAPPHSTVVLCHEPDGSSVSYPGDRFGFNNPDSVWSRPRTDVALIGDSFTQGVCVAPRNNIAGSMSPELRVVNLGLRGSGPMVQLGVATEYAEQLEPGVLVWVYYEGNDPTDLVNEIEVPWLTAYLQESHRQRLVASGEVVGQRYAEWIDSLLTTTPDRAGAAAGIRGSPTAASILKLGRVRQGVGFDRYFPTRQPALPRVEEVLGTATTRTEAWGGRFVMVYLPSERRFRGWFPEGALGRARIGEVADSLDIPLLDMIPTFQATGDPLSLWSRPGGHLSPTGYGLVAREVEAFLEGPTER